MQGISGNTFIETKIYRSTGQQPGTKSGHRSADKPLVNQPSAGRQPLVVIFDPDEIGGNTFVFPKISPGELSALLGSRNGRSGPGRTAPTLKTLKIINRSVLDFPAEATTISNNT